MYLKSVNFYLIQCGLSQLWPATRCHTALLATTIHESNRVWKKKATGNQSWKKMGIIAGLF